MNLRPRAPAVARHPSIEVDRIEHVAPDGDCLFRAFEIATEGNGDPLLLRKWLARRVDRIVCATDLLRWNVDDKSAFVKFLAELSAYNHNDGDIVVSLLCALKCVNIKVIDIATGLTFEHSASFLRAEFQLPKVAANEITDAPHAMLLEPNHYNVYLAPEKPHRRRR